MKPLWEEFNDPEYSRYSMGWRMGPGEDYSDEWYEWFMGLSDLEKKEYIDSNPEPNSGRWSGYYESIMFKFS